MSDPMIGAERALVVDRTGPLVTVQDLGRPGWAHLGVPRSGAADRASLRRANRLVGNVEGAAGLEVLLGGLQVTAASAHLVVAVCGADCPVTLDGRAAPRDAVLDLPPGSRLALGTSTTGLRAYLAVRGGVDVAPVLGSRSRDTLAGLGPEPLRPGAILPVGAVAAPGVCGLPVVDVAPVAAVPDGTDPDDVVLLPAWPGPRADWLDEPSTRALWHVSWHVEADSDRVGVRLSGPALLRATAYRDVELPSEGLVRGAVQVPPSGQPVLFLADHPVTGGYPVTAVVLDEGADRVAQVRPGRRVRLVPAHDCPFRPDLRCLWWGW